MANSASRADVYRNIVESDGHQSYKENNIIQMGEKKVSNTWENASWASAALGLLICPRVMGTILQADAHGLY